MAKFALEFLFVFILILHAGQAEYKRVCYYTNWSQYRPGAGKFLPGDIDPSLCTHLIYAFGKLEGNKIEKLEWNDYQLYEQINDLKQTNPSLKTLLAMGGWTAGSVVYSNMVSSPESRAEFIQSSIDYLREWDFDGLDMDWEYPANRGGLPSDKQNFGLLVKELREAYESESEQTGLDRLLLTAAVAAGKATIDSAYDVPTMAQYMDFINIMSYDLHGSWESFTGHNSPLFPKSNEYGSQRYLNIEFAANYWNTLGVPKHKLIIGLATYGRTFTLSSGQTGIGAPARGPGTSGQYTREAGFLSYYEICLKLESGQGWTVYDAEHKVPYYTDGTLWAGYDDVTSLSIKVHWLVTEGYGGAMIWALALDDFRQTCSTSSRRYPLINTIKDLLQTADAGGTLTTAVLPTGMSSAATPPTTSTGSTTQNNSGTGFSCVGKQNSLYSNPSDCSKFYQCHEGTAFSMSCPGDLLFNAAGKFCDYPSNVACEVQLTSKASVSTTLSISTTPQNSVDSTSFQSTASQVTSSTTASTSSTSMTTTTEEPTASETTVFSSTPSSSTTQTTFSLSPSSPATHKTATTSMTTAKMSTSLSSSNPIQTTTGSTSVKVTTEQASTTQRQSIPASEFCKSKDNGYYFDPVNCGNYYLCFGFWTLLVPCPSNLYWNYKTMACDWPKDVDCTRQGDLSTTEASIPPTTSSSSSSSLSSSSSTSSSSSSSSSPSSASSTSSSSSSPLVSSTTLMSTSSTESSVSSDSTLSPSSSITEPIVSTTEQDTFLTSGMSSQSSSTTTEAQQSTTTKKQPDTVPFDYCFSRLSGFHPHPSDCSKYITCFGAIKYIFDCPATLWWNPSTKKCDWKENVSCDV